MEPKIIFLGTAGDFTLAGRQTLASGGVVIQVDNDQYHIDPGPGTLNKARELGVHLRNTTAVLVSKKDLLSCNDVNALIKTMSASGLDVHGVLLSTQAVLDEYVTESQKRQVEKAIALTPGKRVGINNVEIYSTKTTLPEDQSIGFKLITPSFSVGYTSDTGFSDEVAEQFKGLDIIIMHTQVPVDVEDEHTMNANDVIRFANTAEPKLILLTRFGTKMAESDLLEVARTVQRNTNIQTVIAKDGMAVNPVTASSTVRKATPVYR